MTILNLKKSINWTNLKPILILKKVEEIKNSSLEKMNNLISEGKNIIGYGAPAKATTLLNYYGINDSYFEYVVEDSVIKHNKYIPGTNIKIIDKTSVDPLKIDTIIVLAWNFLM